MIDEQELLLRVLRGDAFLLRVKYYGDDFVVNRAYKLDGNAVYCSPRTENTTIWKKSDHTVLDMMAMLQGKSVEIGFAIYTLERFIDD